MRTVEDRKTAYAIMEDGKVTGTCWDKREAQLFCAAPDMLEALKEAEELLAMDAPDESSAMKRIRAAIAKAEGRP